MSADAPAPSRRDLLLGLAAAPALTLPGTARAVLPAEARSSSAPPASSPASDAPLVGMQIGARSFVDEGVDRCLDTLQRTGGVNTIMAAVFTYGTGLAGRQSRDEPLPDHGVQQYDSIHGGSYAAVHPEFYRDSVIRDIRAPDLGRFDILADVIPKARARGMRTYALFEENYNPRLIPDFEKVAEVDLYGRTGRSTCFNNPDARAFLSSMVADWVTSNPDLDGLMWESERQGPLNNLLGAHFNVIAVKRRAIGCFCHHCLAKAREQGIDGQRAREGFFALDRWVDAMLAGPRVADGAFVSLWRVLLEHPELLQWERLWYSSQEEAYGLIYGTAKAINPKLQVGWHIMHLITMSPFYSADTSYARLADIADYLKPSPYNNCGGPRLATYIRNVQSTVFRDFEPEQVLEMHYKLMGLAGEPSLDALPTAGLSGASVGVETRKAVADVGGRIPIYPGIDIDIPTDLDEKRTRPQDVRDATMAALEAGAAGVVLSRKYAEMRLANIAGAKEALERFHQRRHAT
jgi:hypothetical protein